MRFPLDRIGNGGEITSSASLVVFTLALSYTGFAGKLFDPVFGSWSGPLFSLGLALIPVLIALCLNSGFSRTFRLKRPGFRQMVGGLTLAGGMFLAVLTISLVLSVVIPDMPVSSGNLGTNVLDANIFRVVFSVVIMPAIGEELLFRGFILSGFANSLNKTKSIVLCAALFSFLHLEPLQLPFAFSVGIGLSWVALETGSLWVPILMHAFHNLALLLIVRGLAARGDGLPAIADFANPSSFVVSGVCLLLAVLVSVMLVRAGIRLVSRPVRGFPTGENSIE